MVTHSRPFIGVDLGGTSLLAAVVTTDDGQVIGECKRKTRAELGARGVAERVVACVERAVSRSGCNWGDIGGIGVGVPGPVNPQTGVVVRCANLGPSWDMFPLAGALSQLLERGGEAPAKMAITVDNDVNVGALGEHAFGAGRGTRNMLAIFVGTGVGGGIIIDGKLVSGSRNSAGEVGHIILVEDGPMCGCGERGHAEALASRSAIERDIRAAIADGQESIISRLLEDAGRSEISSGTLGDAYEAGDAVTAAAVQRAQHYLGLLIASCVNLLDPEAIVVGGGVLERFGEAYLGPVREVAMSHYLNKVDAERVRIVRASLGDYSGAMGAAVLAQQRLS